MKMIHRFVAATALVAATPSLPANAATLLNLVDAPYQNNTPYSLSFTASSTSTTLSVGGYQLPSDETATLNAVRLGTGANLLGQTWIYTPASNGPDANQFNDGSSVNGLDLAGLIIGSYDTFSQTFATIVGGTYNYSFLYTNSSTSAPSGFRVDVNAAAAGAVPEPATWGMMILGFGMIGAAARSRKTKTSVTFA